MHPQVIAHPDRAGLLITDPIENARFALYTDDDVTPRETEPEEFYFPVDAAVTVETSGVEIPKLGNVFVRTQTGTFVTDNAARTDTHLAPDAYLLELTTAPMKLYLAIESALTIEHGEQAVMLSFDDTVAVRVGTRSFHERPAGTIRTTEDVRDVMRAVSLFGSALKTTSSERSFPTLRGHPPLVELDDEFDAPDGLVRPDTGVELVLPPEREYVYPAAPLAYYLGAELVPGGSPRLVADGFEYDLDGPDGYETTVHRALQQSFFFDCLTRTEGYYQVDLHERRQVEPLVDVDFGELYDASLPARLETYLSVPFETIRSHVPEWNLTTDVTPIPEHCNVLPFVANDLALVRCPPNPAEMNVVPTLEAQKEFFRDAHAADDDFVRSAGEQEVVENIFKPDPTETVEHAWVGDGYPLGANKVTAASQRRRLEREPAQKEHIEIHVVCNDEAMQEEGAVVEHYGLRDLLQFDVNLHYDLTTDELRELLAAPSDFLHYIGHVDINGMRCSDGYLDARTLSDVRVKAFLLNACRSYEQGEALVDAGSFGGVVTLSEVANRIATKVGKPLARLLNCGFPLRVALSIAQDQVSTGYRYITVGDGGMMLVQNESGSVTYPRVEQIEEGYFSITIRTHPLPHFGLGSLLATHITEDNTRYLTSGEIGTFEVTTSELQDYFSLETIPVEFREELRWSDELLTGNI
ncbi:hypothetical protein [Haladaptatus salinisoli]|uniref:hypothetical protein n=1 Tax=Haladaptatus salinisoli TaxID=2884876 RepID=UPI001D0B73DF|nr:hypothetical protein [Haladaptatus salinisoli]